MLKNPSPHRQSRSPQSPAQIVTGRCLISPVSPLHEGSNLSPGQRSRPDKWSPFIASLMAVNGVYAQL